MTRWLTTLVTAALLAACSGRDGAPETEPHAGLPAGEVHGGAPGDTVVGGFADGVATDDPDMPVSSDGAVGPAPAGAPGAAATTGTGPTGATSPARAGGGSPPSTGTAPPAGAAAAPTAPAAPRDGAAILRRAAAAYEGVRSLRAEFVMNFENPLLRQRVTSRGTLYQRQPDRIALHFTEPAGDVIVGDGRYFWVYYPSNNAQQVIRSPAAAAGETGVNLQAQFVGNPLERFDHTLEGTESVGGRQAQVLLLVPRQRAEYRSLRVWLDDRDALARRFEITEHNGNVRRFDLQGMQVNPAIPDAVFRFTPPDGVRIIPAG
jgi:outer membrane lipoprotein carrier protein